MPKATIPRRARAASSPRARASLSEGVRGSIVTLRDGRRVRLRPMRAGDAARVAQLERLVAAEGRYSPWEPDEVTIASVRRRRSGGLDLIARPLGGSTDRSAGIVGRVRITPNRLRRTRHVGRLDINIHPDWRGEGLGGAMLDTAIQWARSDPGLAIVTLRVLHTNARAIALYERRGFTREGCARCAVRMHDGTFAHDVLMALEVRDAKTRASGGRAHARRAVLVRTIPSNAPRATAR